MKEQKTDVQVREEMGKKMNDSKRGQRKRWWEGRRDEITNKKHTA
jgi:hypothetical protein